MSYAREEFLCQDGGALYIEERGAHHVVFYRNATISEHPTVFEIPVHVASSREDAAAWARIAGLSVWR